MGSLNALPGVLDTILAEMCGGGEEDSQPPRCYESLVPIVPRVLPEVRSLMQILQCSFEVSDASSLSRKRGW